MHESDPPASGTGAWRVVDEAIAGGPAGGERRVEVGHSVAHMMDSRPPTSEKSRDGAVRIPGRQQLDLGLTEGQSDDGGAIRHLGRVRLETEHVTIEGERRLDVRHGDPDMSDPGGSRHAVPPNENDIEVDQPWEK